jgi:drug/metabolite transporter (DMT)-like permease
MRLRVLLGLVLCNAIWATNPMMGKLLLRDFAPMHVSFLRYSSSVVVAILAILIIQRKPSKIVTPPKALWNRKYLPWIFLTAIATFLGSPIFQYLGLSASTSTANNLIVAMEPLFAALLAWAILREPLNKKQSVAFVFALGGFLLLSNFQPGNLDSLALLNIGNLFMLSTMPMEATYSVVSRKIEGKVGALTLYLAAALLGFFLFSFYLIVSEIGFPDFRKLTQMHWMAVIWMGPLGTCITYIYWTIALEKATVAAVSLTLFVQPILGTFVGSFFLREKLSNWQMVGAAFILFALLFQTSLEIKKGRSNAGNHR